MLESRQGVEGEQDRRSAPITVFERVKNAMLSQSGKMALSSAANGPEY
jgi:hypothetical protein